MTDMKSVARHVVATEESALVELSARIHAHPELAFAEERAARWTAEALSIGGFSIDAGVCNLPTAFIARAGTGTLNIGICAEYDALAEIGHACGHNVIAAAAVGAALALQPLLDDLDVTLTILGTPAEEGGGGKILMLDRGGFAGIHAAMMVHPSSRETIHKECLAAAHFDVHYEGKAAHASAAPERGINAADAITIAQVAIGLLRQHIPSTDRVHGIVTKGGDAANVVPAHTSANFFVRSKTLATLAELQPRVERCFEAGALATGCVLEIESQMPNYSQFDYDTEMAAIYKRNAESLGRVFPDGSLPDSQSTWSTDMANVSLAVPSIHPMLDIGSGTVSNHQAEFAAFAVSEGANRALLDGALAMACTIIDIAADARLRKRLQSGSKGNVSPPP